jgi:hypothetical protein
MEGIREQAVSDRQRMHHTCVAGDIDVSKFSDLRKVQLPLSIGLSDECRSNSFLGEPTKQISNIGDLIGFVWDGSTNLNQVTSEGKSGLAGCLWETDIDSSRKLS